MPIRIALLRSMVVNGHRVTAADVRALAEAVGATNIRAVASTGNIVFDNGKSPAALTRALEAACEARFGKPTEIIVKTERQWRALVAANPFKRHASKTPNRVLAWIMRTPVTAKGLAQLRRRATRQEPIRRVVGGNFYILFGNPNRDDTKIPAGFGLKALGAVGTNRTWTTVSAITRALDEMKAGSAAE
jgi:uncharacterized protein (DUF1697 family)